MQRILMAVLCLSMAACAPGVKIQSGAPRPQLAPLATQEPFLVIKEGEGFNVQGEELGDIQIKDTGFTLICDYDKVEALAVERAKSLGANTLWIYEHRLPSLRSTCHQIRAKAMRLPDLTPYEKEIVWTPARRLQQADFKGSIENRPFQAATSSSIRYRYRGQGLGKVRLQVETYFDCRNSYFKPSAQNEQVLAHEQVHFDIVELHARLLTRLLQEQAPTSRELEQRHEAVFRQVLTECQTMQDAYDSEVYKDPGRLPLWQQKVAQQLTALQPYADKSLTVKTSL
ncbi:DUF922 domain-containing protein [Hymenobacter psychrotolerans]|nr:hypothetical protein [Hymenobacter psychrotolerans]